MPSLIDDIQAEQIPMEVYFRHLHQHPELAFEETESAAYIAGLLRQWGYEVTEGIGGTGVVARMQLGDGTTSIGLRADTDALPVPEMTDLPYKSKVAGKSHTCGHDAHTTMLLGAAQYLARKGNFNGTLNLIFQPAEEIMAGAPAMLGDDLLRRFPMDYMFGLHNMPGLEAGTLYLTAGPVMAAVDNWEIELTGKGGHGSMPERCIDPLVAGSALVMSLQTIVSRNVAAQDAVVVTIGAFNSGEAGNVIPQNAVLRLSVRSRAPDTRSRVLDRIRAITAATAEGYNVGFEIREGQPGAVLVNDDEQTRICTEVACRLLGEERVVNPGPTFMGSEDFAFFAQQRPSVYGFLGNGDTPMVHHPEYACDPANLPVGAAYWVAITQHYLR